MLTVSNLRRGIYYVDGRDSELEVDHIMMAGRHESRKAVYNVRWRWITFRGDERAEAPFRNDAWLETDLDHWELKELIRPPQPLTLEEDDLTFVAGP